MKWYIIHSYSGFERKVKESLESRVQAFGLRRKDRQGRDPHGAGDGDPQRQEVYRGADVLSRLRAGADGPDGLPHGGEGDHVWHVVKSTPRVTGFVGTANDPTPLTEEEVNQIIYRVNVGQGQAEAQA